MKLSNLFKKNSGFMDFNYRGLTFKIPKKCDIIPSQTTQDVFIGDPKTKTYFLIFHGPAYVESTFHLNENLPSLFINGIEIKKAISYPQFADMSLEGVEYMFEIDGQYFAIFVNNDVDEDIKIEKILEKIKK